MKQSECTVSCAKFHPCCIDTRLFFPSLYLLDTYKNLCSILHSSPRLLSSCQARKVKAKKQAEIRRTEEREDGVTQNRTMSVWAVLSVITLVPNPFSPLLSLMSFLCVCFIYWVNINFHTLFSDFKMTLRPSSDRKSMCMHRWTLLHSILVFFLLNRKLLVVKSQSSVSVSLTGKLAYCPTETATLMLL